MVESQYPPKSNNIKRQSPLVNAGYAIRVASISKMVYEFIHCHCSNDDVDDNDDNDNDNDGTKHKYDNDEHSPTVDDASPKRPKVNVIIIGCGLDIFGIVGSEL